MTPDEFADLYAERSGLSREVIDRMFRVAPCDCGEPDCDGWKMTGSFDDGESEPLGHYP